MTCAYDSAASYKVLNIVINIPVGCVHKDPQWNQGCPSEISEGQEKRERKESNGYFFSLLFGGLAFGGAISSAFAL